MSYRHNFLVKERICDLRSNFIPERVDYMENVGRGVGG